jgi:hypothetical protein
LGLIGLLAVGAIVFGLQKTGPRENLRPWHS